MHPCAIYNKNIDTTNSILQHMCWKLYKKSSETFRIDLHINVFTDLIASRKSPAKSRASACVFP
jgi:hypothetical protein